MIDEAAQGRPAAAVADEGMIELRGVGFEYGPGVRVLEGFDAAVENGGVVGIVGPSGCGKSTLLYLIAKLLEPSHGSIERRFAPGRHPLSMVFQKETLLPWLTAADNVRFFTYFDREPVPARVLASLRRGGRSVLRAIASSADEGTERTASAEIDRRVEWLLRLVKLDDRADAYPYQLSGGMRRRLQFVASVAPLPQVLLLDEPFSSVDEPTRIGIHQDVFKILRSLEMTAVLVTHDLAEAITLCDRVIILSQRPARIVGEHVMPFGEDRDMLAIRATPEYLSMYGRLWDDLRREIAGTPSSERSSEDEGGAR